MHVKGEQNVILKQKVLGLIVHEFGVCMAEKLEGDFVTVTQM